MERKTRKGFFAFLETKAKSLKHAMNSCEEIIRFTLDFPSHLQTDLLRHSIFQVDWHNSPHNVATLFKLWMRYLLSL